MSFAVWLTGADRARVDAVADAIADRLRSRALAVELLDARTPGADALTERAAVLVADTLARHGVATIVALPIAPDVARGAGMRMIEVCVRGEAEGQPAGCPEVELESAAGVERVIGTLEVLGLLPRGADRYYTEDEERAVIRRLKAFGYL